MSPELINEYGFSFIVLITLSLILVALLAIVRQNRRNEVGGPNYAKALEQMTQAANQHIAVNAVLALTKTFADQPELMKDLAKYSRQTVGATLVLRVNQLSAAIKKGEETLKVLRSLHFDGQGYESSILRNEVLLTRLYSELAAANRNVESFQLTLV